MLDRGCLEFLGGEVCCVPRYGWGWTFEDRGERGRRDYAFVEAAGAFAVQVSRFFEFGGELRGLVGEVSSTDHPFHGLHLVAAQMLGPDLTDLTDRICIRWDIELGNRPPHGDGWPEFEPEALFARGCVMIGSSRRHIEAAWARL